MRRNLRILFFQKLFSPGKKLIPRLTCNEKNTGNNISTTVCIQEIFCIVYKVDTVLHSSICIFFIDFQSNPWNSFLGDCSVVDQYLAEKPISLKWFFAHYINVFLRAVGQVPI